jgi:hypothetical protein
MVMIPVSTLNALGIRFWNQDIIQYGLGVWNSTTAMLAGAVPAL